MVGDYERAAKLCRHHIEVLARIEAQLRRGRDAIDEFDSFRQPHVEDQHPRRQPTPRTRWGEAAHLTAKGAATDQLRYQSADIAEAIAQSAEAFASFLEHTAARGDEERRQQVAAAERQIATVERRNAATLRDRSRGHTALTLEDLPHLP